MTSVLNNCGHNNKIEKIIHISDLHVRAGDTEKARIYEYNHVFTHFIQEISVSSLSKNAIIVISGDIFHNKTYVGVQGVTMLLEFIAKILEISPVIVISGNHDSLQQESSTVDSLDMLKIAFTSSKTKYTFHYLKETGLYSYNNVGFGVVSIRDVLRTTSGSGIVDKLPEYPNANAFEDTVDIKVALFHGSVFKNGRGGYPIKWFMNAGYDFGVFGDCHKQQINDTDGFIWGYPGSLIQQDNGESTNGHGYLLWNNKDKSVTAYNIINNYGSITMQRKEGTWYVRFGTKNIKEFKDAIVDKIFPKFPKIRFIGNGSDKRDLHSILKDNSIEPLLIQSTICVGSSIFEEFEGSGGNGNENGEDGSGVEGGSAGNSLQKSLNAICDMNNKDNWIKYIKEVYPDISDVNEYIDNPSKTICIQCDDIMPEEIKTKIKNRNETINKVIEKYEGINMNGSVNNTIRFKYIEWDYILCYGKDNFIDFTKMDKNITLINGQNATGKSAFLDVLVLCIFGEPTSMRTQVHMGKTMSSKIISDQRPHHERSGISLIFDYIGDEGGGGGGVAATYEITRSFNTQSKDDSRINTFYLVVYKLNNENKTKEVVAEMALATAWIRNVFGTLQNMELSNMMCQIDINNFFMQPNDIQREILERAMNMESISAYSEILAESIKAYKYITDALKTFKSGMTEHAIVKVSVDEINHYAKLTEDITSIIEKNRELDEERLRIRSACSSFDKDKDKDKLKPKDEDIGLSDKGIDKKIEKSIEITKAFNISENEYIDTIELQKSINKELKSIVENIATFSEKEIADFEEGGGGADAADPAAAQEMDSEEPIFPPMTIESVRKMQSHYNAWVEKQNKEWLDNPDGLDSQISIIENKMNRYKEQLEYFEKLGMSMGVSKPKTSISEMAGGFVVTKIAVKDLETSISKLHGLKNRHIELLKERIVPCRLVENKETWEIKYKRWLKQIGDSESLEDSHTLKTNLEQLKKYVSNIESKFERIAKINERFAEIQEEIMEIEQLPFNPECEACKQQVHRKRYEAILIEGKNLKKELAKLRKSVTGIEVIHVKGVEKPDFADRYVEIEELPNLISQRKFYETTCDSMKDEVDAWNKAAEEWKLVKKNKKELTEIENEIAINEWNIYESYNTVINKSKNGYRENRELLTNMQAFIKEYDEYREEYNTIEDNLILLDAWKEWNMKKRRNEYYEFVKNKKDKEIELDAISDKILVINKYEESKKDIEYWQNIKIYKHYLKICQEYKELNEKLETMRNEHTLLGKKMRDADSHKLRVSDISDFYDTLIKKYELLQQIQKCIIGDSKKGIDGFRHWIFANKALPLVESEMNGFLSEIDTIQVNISFNTTGFIYTVTDRGNTPSLNTISGYQKFIVNLAMRMALTRIGKNVNVNTLFIDEGFTSFDSVNIGKIKDIFNILLQRFNSIMVASHMDIVRDVVDRQINIERSTDDKLSRLYYGEEYPKYKKVKSIAATGGSSDGDEKIPENVAIPKKKGRPSKK